METQRIDPPAAASELDMLLAWLEYPPRHARLEVRRSVA